MYLFSLDALESELKKKMISAIFAFRCFELEFDDQSHF